MRRGLIRDRLATLAKIDHSVLTFIEETARREDLIRWGRREDRTEVQPDLTEYVKVNPFKSLTALIP